MQGQDTKQRLIVGLCGAHGTGKSTIIKAVKELGYCVDESQLSRAAQAALGWDSLSKAQESEDNMWKLQDAILAAMLDRDERIISSGARTLVDRTPADVWGYTALWASRLGGKVDQERLHNYKRRCHELSAKYLRHVIVPIREEILFVSEHNRADLESRAFHDSEVRKFVSGVVVTHEIISINIDYRAVEVARWLDKPGEAHDREDAAECW